MLSGCHTALMGTLGVQFALSKSRLVTFAVLIIGLAGARTVNLTHLAGHLPSEATHASGYRRLQRFFQFVRLDTDRVALLVVRMLGLERRKCLALDRTNWKIGATDVNVLMLAIVTRRFRVPLMWTLLPHQGSSDTGQRIALMRRYVALFGVDGVECLLADREFIGTEWMDFLNENNIPFVIRLKENMTLTLENGQTWSLRTLLRKRRAKTATTTLQGRLNGQGALSSPLQIAARRLSGAWLVVASNTHPGRHALNLYRRRWAIECLFADAKTRGLNLEDTRLRDPAKLNTLLAIVALAITWAYRCATRKMGRKAVARKSHGRPAKSWFRTGLDLLRKWLINTPQRAIAAWRQTAPNRPLSAT